MADPRSEYTRKAVSVMTAYLERPDGASALMADLVTEATRAGEAETNRLVGGFINLAAYLLVMLERDAGREPLSVLQGVAAYGL